MCNVSGTERILYKGQQTRTKQKAALTAKGQIQKRSDNMEDKKDILSIAERQYGITTPLPEDYTVAMAYIPYQQKGRLYSAEQGINEGMLFPELNKPFCCGKDGAK